MTQVDSDRITRIAMWSGPRNISTAMMRAWENRPDAVVTDEPFYAHYLVVTGIQHPGREEIIASQATDWREVIQQCTLQQMDNSVVHYQKHMTQHMLPHIDLNWLTQVKNIFLIRSPEEVVASYSKARPDLTPEDLGFEQQQRLYSHIVTQLGYRPLVIESRDVLKKPETALRTICDYCGVEFSDAMLNWPTGKRESDGVWAPYWYENVERSTGFIPYKPQDIELDDNGRKIAEQCTPFYAELREGRVLL